MDGILRLDKKWKWKVDIFLKKIVKSVEVESGKAEKWITFEKFLVACRRKFISF